MNEYSHGETREPEITCQVDLSPPYLRLNMALSGLVPPEVRTVCELAFGDGVTLIIGAACN
jgi:hypothetical protein